LCDDRLVCPSGFWGGPITEKADKTGTSITREEFCPLFPIPYRLKKRTDGKAFNKKGPRKNPGALTILTLNLLYQNIKFFINTRDNNGDDEDNHIQHNNLK
jgi:hypothetical protein